MKKTFLLITAGLLASSYAGAFERSYINLEPAPAELTASIDGEVRTNAPTRADEGGFIDFTYAGDPVTAYRLNNINSGFIYLAFQIPVEDQAPYIGCQISAVSFVTGTSSNYTNLIKSANVFVTDDLSVVPNTKRTVLSTTAFATKTVELDEPFTITGEKPVYVGYRIQYVANTYYLPCDQIPTPSTMRTALVGTATSTTKVPTYVNYSDQEIGSLCIAARITGDNLPTNVVTLTSVQMPGWFPGNQNLEYNLTVKNTGANEVNSLDYKTVISDGNEYSGSYTFDTPLACGEKQTITVTDIPNKSEGMYTLSVSGVAVNGVAAENPSTVSTIYSSYDNGYDRTVVIEEATGNWCGYCPRGIVMMEYLKENYPNWIRIAVHGGSNTEPMLVPGYNEWTNTYVPGFPFALANRAVEVTVAGDAGSYYTPIADYFAAIPSYAKVDVTADYTGTGVEVKSTAKFAIDVDIQHNLSYVIVEDNVGPYSQTNYYYGDADPMGGWNEIKSGTKVQFNDVARAIDEYSGLPNAFPASVTKGTDYEYTKVLPLSYSYGTKPDNGGKGTDINPENASVVALITNAATGEIVNAALVAINTVGVDSVISNDTVVKVAVDNNNIVVIGTDNYAVYTLDGCRVSAQGVNPGVYVVKAADKTFKVLVK